MPTNMGRRLSHESDDGIRLLRPAMTRKKLATSKRRTPRDTNNEIVVKPEDQRSTKRASLKASQQNDRTSRSGAAETGAEDNASSRSSSTPPQIFRSSKQRASVKANSRLSDLPAASRSPRRPLSPTPSVYSSYTAHTGTSSSTNRTVTQQSYNQSRSLVNSNVDVFSFLQEEHEDGETLLEHTSVAAAQDADWDSDSSSSSGSCDGSCDGSCCAAPPDDDTRSVHSASMWDSGVSMSGDSPPIIRKRPKPLPQSPHWRPTQWQDQIKSVGNHEESGFREEKTPMPATFDQREIEYPQQPPPAPSPPPAHRSLIQPTELQHPEVSSDIQPQGYELLASKYCSVTDPDAPSPLYRRFEHLQHRTLLHLQDAISELEAELKMLDDHIAQLTTDATGFHHPQSRRLDRIHPGIGARRHQVLDCLSHCVSQYSMILRSQEASVDSRPPTGQQIEESQAWHRQHQPVPPNESGFLQHTTDLLYLNHTRSAQSIEAAKAAGFITGALASLCVLLSAMILCKIMY